MYLVLSYSIQSLLIIFILRNEHGISIHKHDHCIFLEKRINFNILDST
jgi:hypothetical protein